MESEPSLLSQFSACHAQLNELFLLHQEALLQGQLGNALRLLRCYEACHTLHRQFEDEVLIRRYAGLKQQGRWDATLYGQEHQKIQDLYCRIEEALTDLMAQSLAPSQLRRNIIHLLDREKSFKGLCEHHQEREEASLLPELDRQCDRQWRQQVSADFARLWEGQWAAETAGIRDLL